MLFTLSWPYVKERIWQVVAILAFQAGATIASLQLPNLNARIIDEGVAAGQTDLIWSLGLKMLALSATQMLCTALAVYLGARLAMSLGAHLRAEVFHHVHGFAAHDFHSFGAGSLITRSTNDVQQVQQTMLMSFSVMITAPIMGVGGVIMALQQDLQLGVILAILVPVLALIATVVMQHLSPLFRTHQERIDAMNQVLREELTGIRVIRAFIRQSFVRTRYTQANTQLRSIALKIGTWFSFLFPAVGVAVSLGTVGVVWFGAVLIDAGSLQVGAMIAYITYVAMISASVMMAGMIFIMIPRANVAASRVSEVLNHASSVADPTTPATPPAGPWTFIFHEVSLRYPGAEEAVLENISFELTPGKTTAIIGATASGKTTIVNLLPRMMDATSGEITVNGTALPALPLKALRERIALVPQHSYLFSGTVAEAVAGSRHLDAAQRERVEWALRGAQALDFVNAFDDGIDHAVEPGGTNFSGGQRQRLAIARALYRSADLYVFDDSFSALDYATDARLRQGLPEYTRGAAVLIVAQRVASIRHADEILVIDSGTIIGRGTHEELLESCPTYKEIVDSQLFEEDAA